jgi:hypothetical protein
MITRFDKAIMAAFGAAAAVVTAHGGNIDETVIEQAIGAFLVVGILTFLVPNKAA